MYMYKETEVIVMASNEESDILTMTVMMGGRGDEARATPALGPLSGSRCFERVSDCGGQLGALTRVNK